MQSALENRTSVGGATDLRFAGHHTHSIVPAEQADFADVGPMSIFVPEGKIAIWT